MAKERVMEDADIAYHLEELAIATTNDDARRSLPVVPAHCRRILDVGCGIGQTLVALNLPSSIEAHGIDIDARAIRYGQQEFPQLTLQQASGERLPYPDAYFDMLLCRVALPYMNIPTALQEFHRVLVPGGTVWATLHPPSMAVVDLRESVLAGSIRNAVYRAYVVVNSVLLHVGWQFPYPLNRNRIESYQSASAARRAFERSGFTGIGVATHDGCSQVSATR